MCGSAKRLAKCSDVVREDLAAAEAERCAALVATAIEEERLAGLREKLLLLQVRGAYTRFPFSVQLKRLSFSST